MRQICTDLRVCGSKIIGNDQFSKSHCARHRQGIEKQRIFHYSMSKMLHQSPNKIDGSQGLCCSGGPNTAGHIFPNV